MELHLALDRVRQRLSLVRSFFEGAGLELQKLSMTRHRARNPRKIEMPYVVDRPTLA